MTGKLNNRASKYIEPLNMNRLRGHMLRLKPPKNRKREILLIYDRLSTLENIFPIAKELSKYGGVSVPDLPGFGGMQSFYRIKEKPSLDNLADYLAAFIKLFYKRRRLTIVAKGFGLTIVTRTLQKYPILTKKIDRLISWDGITRYDDIKASHLRRISRRLTTKFLSAQLPAATVQRVLLRPVFIRLKYYWSRKNARMPGSRKTVEQHIDQSIELWRKNNFRTYMYISNLILRVDTCNQQVDLPVYYLALDKNFDTAVTEQHLNVIYSSVELLKNTKSKSVHKPRNTLLPDSLTRLLRTKI